MLQKDIEKKENLNFKDLKERSIRCAIWLRKQNIGAGDVVILSAYNQINNFVIPLSTFFVGAIYSPWDSKNNIGIKIRN